MAEAIADTQDVEPQTELEPDAVVAEGAQDETEPEAPLTVEALASDLGWKPESEWKGSKDKWTPAADFLRSKVDKSDRLASEIRDVRDTVGRISRTTAAITDRAVREERERWEQQFRDATAAGDEQAAWQAAQELHRVPAAREDADQVFEAWRARNPWFDTDPEARAYVYGLGEINKGKPAEEQTRLVDEAVRKRFPELFDEPAPRGRAAPRAPAVNAPASRAVRSAPRGRSEADLPAEARKAGEDFVRRGRVNSLAEYAKLYFEENA